MVAVGRWSCQSPVFHVVMLTRPCGLEVNPTNIADQGLPVCESESA